MNARLKIPSELVRFAGGQSSLEISGSTIGEILNELVSLAPDLRPRIVDHDGELHAHLAILRNGHPLPQDRLRRIKIEDADQLEIFFVASGG